MNTCNFIQVFKMAYSYQGVVHSYNRSLSFGQYTTAFAYHQVLGQGDRPCSGLSQGDLSSQLDWVTWFFGQTCSICFEGSNYAMFLPATMLFTGGASRVGYQSTHPALIVHACPIWVVLLIQVK